MTEAELILPARTQALSPAGWLTIERTGYAGATLLALGLRLYGLGLHALTPAEAAQALPAWQAAAGRAFDPAGASPLLFTLQRFLFIALPATDAAARFWPALLGGLAPLLFYALRDRLGRGGALAAACLWAISPLAVFTGRLGLGYGLVPPLALALLAALNLFLRQQTLVRSNDFSRSPAAAAEAATTNGGDGGGVPSNDFSRSAPWPAITFGLLLCAGTGAYTVALVALLAAVVWQPGRQALAEAFSRQRKPFALALFLSVALAATGFLTFMGGLSLAADLPGRWLTGLLPTASPLYGAWDILAALLIDEPLLLAAGLAGIILAWRRHDGFGKLAAILAGVSLLAALLGGGRNPEDLGLVVIPLVLLAGPAVAWTGRAAIGWRRDPDAWMLLLLSLILLASATIGLVTAVNYSLESARVLYGVGAAVTGSLSVGLWLVFYAAGSRSLTGRVLPALGLIVALIWGAGRLVAVNYNLEPGVNAGVSSDVPAPGWALLREQLQSLDGPYGTGKLEVPIDLWVRPAAQAGPGIAGALAQADPLLPMLQWELKDYRNLRLVQGALPAVPSPVIITPMMPGTPPGTIAGIPEGYGGAAFDLLRRGRPVVGQGVRGALRWLLYEQAGPPAARWQAVLWINRSAARSSGPATSGFVVPGAIPQAPPGAPQ